VTDRLVVRAAAASSPHRRWRCLVLITTLVALSAAPVEARDDEELDPVVVTATRGEQSLRQVPASMTIVERSDIQDGQRTLNVDEALMRVPGVFAQSSSNFAQDVRLQIRGFGSRAEFGVREVRVLVDGLPETLPDGQTELDAVDMGAIGRIEVLRGASSALYGNASGGVIQLFTEEPPETPRAEVRSTGGSYGFAKVQVKGGGRVGAAGVFLHAAHTRLDGYRAQSGARSTNATLKLRYDLSPDTDLALLIHAVDAPRGDDPGGLRRAEVDTDPRAANPRNLQFDTGEEVQQGRLGVVAKHRFVAGEVSAYAYALYRDFANRLPIGPTTPAAQGGIVAFHRFSPGGGIRYLGHGEILGWHHTLTAGVDVQHQADARRRFVNLDGKRGQLGLQQDEEVTSLGPYVREAIDLTDRLQASAGLRYDVVRLAVDVDLPAGAPASGSRTLDAWSPSVGLVYRALPQVSVFANVGSMFQVPTTTELANPDGAGFNPAVDPQRAITTEIGTRVDNPTWRAGLAGFFIDVSDVLVRYETADQPGRAFFRNGARARRFGIELDWAVQLLPGVRWSGAVTAMQTQFSEGPAEPGVPPWQIFQELRYDHRLGLFAAVEMLAVDGYPVDTANRARARGYQLGNLRSGYRWEHEGWAIEPFIGLYNLSDATYDARVRINEANQRFFEPGFGFNAYGGVALSATL